MEQIAFAENVKRLRKKAGWTRAALSEKLHYSEKSVEKWESGAAVPPVSTLCELAGLFQVTLDELVRSRVEGPRAYLGIDGGGTKTEFLLTDPEGTVLSRCVLGGSNPVDLGVEGCMAVLEQGVRTVCREFPLREVSAFAGLSGGISGDNKARIADAFGRLGFYAAGNGSDADNALELALGGGDGVMLIMGTGIVCFSRSKGELPRSAGWGHMVDRGGSGVHFGSDVLDAAFKYFDGRGGSEKLFRLAEEQLGAPLSARIPALYAGGKSAFAALAPCAFRAAAEGDEVALAILKRNAAEAALILSAALKGSGNRRAVICGGLAHHKEQLEPLIRKGLPEGTDLTFCADPPVLGAVALAKKQTKENGPC